MYQLQIKDERGFSVGQTKKGQIALILTDDGFRVTYYGNEIVDAINIKEDGKIVVNSNRMSMIGEGNGYYEFKLKEY